jgi:anthranilate phosphoribosyltransferase
MNLTNAITKISDGDILTETEMEATMRVIMSGEADESDLEDFLIKLSDRGEHVSEITGAARVMREMASTIKAPPHALDCCGTGGDAAGTYNISTAVALVSAACGVPVAKHGNRAASSRSGAADVLEALGANLNVSQALLEETLKKINFCFLMAPNHHQAMKHVAPVRKKLKRRTIFNILGPLANPAGTKYQLIGAYDKKWVRPMVEVLQNLGTKAAWVVHGRDGLDEITTTDKTDIAILGKDQIIETTISPDDFGLKKSSPDKLKGGSASENAWALKRLLEGKKTAYRDIVVANTAAVLNIHGKADGLKHGVQLASDALYEGRAEHVLKSYIKMTGGIPL